MMSTVIFFITLSLFILNFLLSSSVQARGCAATQSTGQAWTGPGRGSNNKPKRSLLIFIITIFCRSVRYRARMREKTEGCT